jgi:hypothetical protein
MYAIRRKVGGVGDTKLQRKMAHIHLSGISRKNSSRFVCVKNWANLGRGELRIILW